MTARRIQSILGAAIDIDDFLKLRSSIRPYFHPEKLYQMEAISIASSTVRLFSMAI